MKEAVGSFLEDPDTSLEIIEKVAEELRAVLDQREQLKWNGSLWVLCDGMGRVIERSEVTLEKKKTMETENTVKIERTNSANVTFKLSNFSVTLEQTQDNSEMLLTIDQGGRNKNKIKLASEDLKELLEKMLDCVPLFKEESPEKVSLCAKP